MGSAASIVALTEAEVAKPADASDLKDLEAAKAELKRLRQLARDFQKEQESLALATDATPNNPE